MERISNPRGQTTVEAAVVLMAAIFIVGSLMVATYMVMSDYVIDHWTYEAAICLAKGDQEQKNEKEEECHSQLTEKLGLLPFLEIATERIDLIQQDDHVSAEVRVIYQFFNMKKEGDNSYFQMTDAREKIYFHRLRYPVHEVE